MNELADFQVRIQARSTGTALFERATALTVLLSSLAGTVAPAPEPWSEEVRDQTAATTQLAAVATPDLVQLVNALSSLHEQIVENSVDLDADLKRALYARLWDLYV